MPRVSRAENERNKEIVLKALFDNPDQSVADISLSTGLSETQVYKIYRDFREQGVVFGNPAILDLSKTGKKRYIGTLKLVSGDVKPDEKFGTTNMRDMLLTLASFHLDIIHEDEYACDGSFDWVLVFLANNVRDATQFMNAICVASHDEYEVSSLSEVEFTIRRCSVFSPEMKDYVRKAKDSALLTDTRNRTKSD
ncbi:MAG: winged helix-turn-helix domain-containing protein [Candidatus Methanomethylophilaceae archaeon]|nr:winged helix-turn-helix domain-containing protein [Candidatus Methanomethylophilaceae archaeon]